MLTLNIFDRLPNAPPLTVKSFFTNRGSPSSSLKKELTELLNSVWAFPLELDSYSTRLKSSDGAICIMDIANKSIYFIMSYISLLQVSATETN